MMSYDQNTQVASGRRLVFEPYPDFTDEALINCGGGACFFDGGRNAGCGKCTEDTRTDGRSGWWRCVDA